jgi:hypothetical protein
MRPASRALGALIIALLLGGCAATLETQVTSFHRLPDGLEGQRFVITATAEQKDSLEFASYAGLVREALAGKGLRDAGADAAADLGVTLHYRVDPVGSASAGGTGGYAGFGIGSGGFSVGTFGIGIGIPIGSGARSGEPATYQRSLQVEIDRLGGTRAATAGAAGRTRVFEGRAISDGPSASLAPVMGAMVRALFREFPGPDGRTRIVTVPVDEPK